jgi:hypothetical protein
MRIVVKRLDGDGRYETVITRDDGVSFRIQGVGYAFAIPHDLAHYLVEKALRIENGFWGSVASGAVFPSMTHFAGRRKPKASERSSTLLKANARALIETEVLVRIFNDTIEHLPVGYRIAWLPQGQNYTRSVQGISPLSTPPTKPSSKTGGRYRVEELSLGDGRIPRSNTDEAAQCSSSLVLVVPARALRAALPRIDWRDFDEFVVPSPCPPDWRPLTTERWIQAALDNKQGKDTGIVDGAIMGEILACPSASQIDKIHVALLDCHDVVRLDRLRKRGTHGVTQDMLSWAAWQRVHDVDPQWRQDVICSRQLNTMRWERWSIWQRGDPRWRVHVLDSTNLTIDQVIDQLLLGFGRNNTPAAIPSTKALRADCVLWADRFSTKRNSRGDSMLRRVIG